MRISAGSEEGDISPAARGGKCARDNVPASAKGLPRVCTVSAPPVCMYSSKPVKHTCNFSLICRCGIRRRRLQRLGICRPAWSIKSSGPAQRASVRSIPRTAAAAAAAADLCRRRLSLVAAADLSQGGGGGRLRLVDGGWCSFSIQW